MKAKNTKRALLASVLSMLLCVAMLVGSTFAWFTDSVTSGKNKIVAGNLDVELEYSTDGSTWETVAENTNMFKDDALWEPGYTEVVYLKVHNAGSLALKYQFGINVEDKVIGKTADDQDIDLSNYIKFGVVEAEAAFADRATAREAVKNIAAPVSGGYASQEGHLTKESTSNMLALVVYMPEEVGNEANHGTDKTQPEIYMGINLVATQDTVENDSFGKDYDKYASYPDATTVSDVAQFTDAIQNAEDGDVIALAGDMELENPMTINKDITIVGNGNTISGKSITTQADVTFKNVKLSKPGNTDKNASCVYAYNGCENLVFDGCTFSDPQWEAMQITSKDLKSVTITNCTFTAANVDGAANSSYGSAADEAIRFIHIQPSNSPVVNIRITNNTFLNCDKVKDSVAGIYYVSEQSTITVGGNTFEALEDEDGVSAKLSVGWPEVEELKTVSYWTDEEKTFVIDNAASNPQN